MRYLLAALLLLTPPNIADPPPSVREVLGPTPTLMVSFPRGAVAACTHFVSSKETIQQGDDIVPYAPTHCWLLDEDAELSGYDDDWQWIDSNGGEWDVYATIDYRMPGDTVQTLETNHLTVVH